MQSIYHSQDEIVEITYNGSPVYQKSSGPDYTEPFYVENLTNNDGTVSINKVHSSARTLSIEYSTNKSDWTVLGNTSTTALNVNVAANSKTYLRCSTPYWYKSYYNAFNTATINFGIGGNIMSLFYGSNFRGNETNWPTNPYGSTGVRAAASMFKDNTYLVDASKLIIPSVNDHYENDFRQMFAGCTSLVSSPILYQQILTDKIYGFMFYGCTSLNDVKCLATDISATECTSNWLLNVSPTGTFTCAQGMSQTWPTGTSGIPSGWTVIEV